MADRRTWSISPRQLSRLLRDLIDQGLDVRSGRDLQKSLRVNGLYPPRDYEHLCLKRPPEAFFTYHSSQDMIEVQELVWNTVRFSANLLRESRPDFARLNNEEIVSVIADCMPLWLDFVFIDQDARDIRAELDVLPVLLDSTHCHFVLGPEPLRRAWCCYEIALFNRRFPAEPFEDKRFRGLPPQQSLRSFIAPTTTIYFGWDHTETTEPRDKDFIGERIATTYPNEFEGFNGVMNQANATAVLSSV
jgi:hypothetical protein